MRPAVASVLLLLGLPACGPAERPSPAAELEADAIVAEAPDAAADSDDATPDATPDATVLAECVEGSQRSCKRTLPSHGQVNNCFVGVETCTNGEWGPCGDEPDPE